MLDRYITITIHVYEKTHFNIFLLKLSLFTMQFHMCRLLQNHFMSGVQVHKRQSNLVCVYIYIFFFQRNKIISCSTFILTSKLFVPSTGDKLN